MAKMLIFLLLLLFERVVSQLNSIPQVKDVSAMCTLNGITASIIFDRPFSGLIYSLGYERIHECFYYNSVLTDSVLFSIPIIGCGTRKSQNQHEMLETLENRVYVQMDKFAQTASDKQFAFVCHQPYTPPLISNDIRRHPSSHGKPITPIISTRYNDNWRPIQPNYSPNYLSNGLDLIHPLDQRKTPVYQTAHTTQSPIFKEASTYSFGQIFGPSQHLELDDFMPSHTNEAVPTHTGEASTDSDSDLLRAYSTNLVPTTSTQQTFSPIIAPNSANNIDIPKPPPETTRLFATQLDKLSDSVQLEIQKGQGPFNRSVDSAVKIGDLITLTVHGKAASEDQNQFNIFVHSCYASDENNTIKVNLIDSSGCAIHSQVLQSMQRLRKGDQIFYYFPLKAFKFPGPTEVFFYCSVDISPEHNFPQACNKTAGRKLRSIHSDSRDDRWIELNLSKNVTIQPPAITNFQRIEGSPETESIGNSVLIGGLLGLLALTVSSAGIAMLFVFKFRK